jgi:hypothetical protein
MAARAIEPPRPIESIPLPGRCPLRHRVDPSDTTSEVTRDPGDVADRVTLGLDLAEGC